MKWNFIRYTRSLKINLWYVNLFLFIHMTPWFEFRNVNNFQRSILLRNTFLLNRSRYKKHGSVRLKRNKFLFKKRLLTYLCTVRIVPDVFILDDTFLTRKVKKEKWKNEQNEKSNTISSPYYLHCNAARKLMRSDLNTSSKKSNPSRWRLNF